MKLWWTFSTYAASYLHSMGHLMIFFYLLELNYSMEKSFAVGEGTNWMYVSCIDNIARLAHNWSCGYLWHWQKNYYSHQCILFAFISIATVLNQIVSFEMNHHFFGVAHFVCWSEIKSPVFPTTGYIAGNYPILLIIRTHEISTYDGLK